MASEIVFQPLESDIVRSFEISFLCAEQLLAQPDLLRNLMTQLKSCGVPG